MVMQGDFETLTRIAQWVSDGKLKPVIDKEFHFSDYFKAFPACKRKVVEAVPF
jgi:NADPH:quinone reductase-like Zn-dependent oxidoreductase